MDKDISKKQNNQACNALFIPSKEAVLHFATYQLDPREVEASLSEKGYVRREVFGILFKLFVAKRPIYFSQATLKKMIGSSSSTYISEVLSSLQELGYLYKRNRYNNSSIYYLHPQFGDPDMWYYLRHLYLGALSSLLLLSTCGYGAETSTKMLRLFRHNPLLIKSLFPSDHYTGADPKLINKLGINFIKGGVVCHSVTGDLQRSGLVYGSSTGVLTRGVDQIARTDMSSTIQHTMARLASQSGNSSTNERNFVSKDPASPAEHRSFVTTTVKHRQASQGESMSIEASAPERPTFDKYPHRPSVEAYEGLRMTPFGMMKLSIIPQGIADSIYNDIIINNKKMPSYDVFMNECLHRCQEMHINMKPLWSQFFKACEQRGIDHKKTATVKQYTAPPTIHPVRQNVLSEEDFWVCERAKYTNRIKWRSLGAFIKNPYEDYMATLESYQYPDLYAMYKEVHVNGMQNPELLPLYHQELCKVFNIPLEDN